MNIRLLAALLLGAVAVSAFTFPKSKFLSRAVIGNDGRHDEYRADEKWKEYGHSTAFVVTREYLKWHSDETYSFGDTTTLGELMGLCPNQHFSSQEVLNSGSIGYTCTAFLVSENQVATHSSCFLADSCEDFRFVFGYDVTEPGVTKTRFFRKDVYKCSSSVTSWEDGYTVVTLDRPVKDRKPLPVAERYVALGEKLATVGHPVNLPRKYAGNARVVYNIENDPSLTWLYYTDLDVFTGDSGSPVINRDTGEVVGILWTRGIGYVYDDNQGCNVAKQCFSVGDAPECFGGFAVIPWKIHSLINQSCKKDKDCSGHGTCTQGTCQCEPGYFGSNCGYWDDNICQGHGTLVQPGQCACNPGYKGQFCQDEVDDGVYITATAQDNTGYFGYSVSIDGPRIAVGQPICLDESAGCTGGHVEIFDITENGIVSSAVLSSPHPMNSACGIFVQLRGDVLFFSCVAFPTGDNQYSAIVQAAVYDHENNVWNYDATIPAPADQGADPLDSSFGSSFAFQEGIIVIGAPGAFNDGTKSGAVFLYVYSDDPSWVISPYKISIPGAWDDKFGSSIALDGPHLAISNDPSYSSRSVTLFFLDDGIHFVTQLQTKSAVAFGFSIDINTNVLNKEGNPTGTAILVVGDPGFSPYGGAVHIYDITNPNNVFLSQTLLPNPPLIASVVLFGFRVVARGQRIGAFYGYAFAHEPIPFGGLESYVTSNGNQFELEATQRTDFLPAGSGFGHTIDFNEHAVVVGAPLAEVNGQPNRGVVVAFGW